MAVPTCSLVCFKEAVLFNRAAALANINSAILTLTRGVQKGSGEGMVPAQPFAKMNGKVL